MRLSPPGKLQRLATPMDTKREGMFGKDNSSENASSPRIPLNRLPLNARWKTEPKRYSTHIGSPSGSTAHTVSSTSAFHSASRHTTDDFWV